MRGIEELTAPAGSATEIDLDAWLAETMAANTVLPPAADVSQVALGGESTTSDAPEQMQLTADNTQSTAQDTVQEGIVQGDAEDAASEQRGPAAEGDDNISEDSGDWDLESSHDEADTAVQAVRHSSRVRAVPDKYDPAAYSYVAQESLTDEPKTLKEVWSRPDASLWDDAMKTELQAL